MRKQRSEFREREKTYFETNSEFRYLDVIQKFGQKKKFSNSREWSIGKQSREIGRKREKESDKEIVRNRKREYGLRESVCDREI